MSSDKEFFIVFDTNVLYQNYEKKADFTNFSFNATFKNIVDIINEYDIYEFVTIAIPEVTLNEMIKQIIYAHDIKLNEFESRLKKYIFPEYRIIKDKTLDYKSYITLRAAIYGKEIKSHGINNVITLPVPSDNRFKTIIKRAFDKKPPFEGKDKNSDKGFKDVLIWESILEFAQLHKQSNIIFYTKDNGFKDTLNAEFKEMYPNAEIFILSSENEIKKVLEEWVKIIDINKLLPIEQYVENRDFKEWIESPDFERQINDCDYGIVEKNRLIMNTCLKLITYENINVISESETFIDYSVDTTLEVRYTFKGGSSVTESIDVTFLVKYILYEYYSIEDAYRTDIKDLTDNNEED